LLDIDWQKFPADVTDVLLMLADVYLMVTNVYPMVAEESSVANIKKVAKIDDKIRKIEQP
jgi:hypothetical protein